MSQPLSRPIRVFVADSSPISGQLLAEAIARNAEIDLLGFSCNPVEVLRIISATHLDVLVLSGRIQEEPDRGILLLQQLRTERPALRAVVLLDSSKPDVVVEAFRSGASGVFCRNGEVQLLHKCIVAVHRGQIWANSEELGFVLAALAGVKPCRFDLTRVAPLSARERQVVRYLVEGLTNREIAEALRISPHTVKNYIFKIFDKLGVSNRVELVFQVLSQPGDLTPMSVNIPVARGRTAELAYRDESPLTCDPESKQVAILQPAGVTSPNITTPEVARAAR